ncbi:MAG: OmpH family outer membrane protein [Lentisphaeria bacterium]|nr:OmpH family outer membrane protein [Lentisphaeria bacterium]
MKIWLTMVLCTVMTLGSVFVSRAEEKPLKIAVIDMNRVFQEYNKTRVNEAKLKKQAEIFKEYSTQLAQSLAKLRQEFVKLRDDSQNMVYSAAERENRRLNAQEKYRQAAAKEQELREYNRERQVQLRDEYEKLRNSILEDISKVVEAKCLAEGYGLVLDKSGRTLNNIPLVVYSSKMLDITDSVIQTLNLGQNRPDPQPVAKPKGSNKK